MPAHSGCPSSVAATPTSLNSKASTKQAFQCRAFPTLLLADGASLACPGLLTCGCLLGIRLIALALSTLLVHHIIEVLYLKQLPLSLEALTTHPLSPQGGACLRKGWPPAGTETEEGRPGVGKGGDVGRWAGGQGRQSDLIGGYSPEVQVGVSGGRVQPILGYISMHILWGCL